MKAYPITEAELTTLGVVQGAAAFFFALFGTCGGFWLSVKQSLAFAGKDTPVAVTAHWQAVELMSGGAAILFGLIGAAAFLFSGLRVRSIKKETEHD